jgi:hypothetical protein
VRTTSRFSCFIKDNWTDDSFVVFFLISWPLCLVYRIVVGVGGGSHPHGLAQLN